MNITATRFSRRALGLAVFGALALSSCGADEVAGFGGGGSSDGGSSDGGGSGASDGGADAPATAAPDLPQLEAGFSLEDFTKEVTVSGTVQPKAGTVVTPTGTLRIDGIQEITSVPADAVGLDPETNEDGEELDFAAAEGEVLRAVDFSFTANSQDAFSTDAALPATDVSIRGGSSQTHLAELTGDTSSRYLLSVPADGSAVLVVSSEGHDQVIDLLTGERQADDVAAAFYREGRVQEPHHTFPAEVKAIPVLYSGEEDSEIAASVSFQATTLTLTAWTKEEGWAEAGSAWLVLDWNSEASLDTEVQGLVDVKGYSATASVTVDGKATTDEFHADKLSFAPSSTKEARALTAAVPVGTTSVTVGMSGGFSIEFDGMGGAYETTGSLDRAYTAEELTVEFPPTGDASGAPASNGGGAQPSDGGGS
ncbi:MAG: hypothetical protein ACTIB2_12660 [Brachybacterium tyrofermentans]